MENLKKILKQEIKTYKKWKKFQEDGSVEEQYCLNEAWTLFHNLTFSQCFDVMEQLTKE